MILYKSMIKRYKTTHVIVFKTGNLYELDLASCALEGKNIKFYKQEETSSALRLKHFSVLAGRHEHQRRQAAKPRKLEFLWLKS
jgi:hypothetical protein